MADPNVREEILEVLMHDQGIDLDDAEAWLDRYRAAVRAAVVEEIAGWLDAQHTAPLYPQDWARNIRERFGKGGSNATR